MTTTDASLYERLRLRGWRHIDEVQPFDGEQVWVYLEFGPNIDGGCAFAIWHDDEKDWFFDVAEDGDLITRSTMMRDRHLTVAAAQFWYPIPAYD
jgi:hypothetical protein